jgi:hypothetical protein
MKLKNLKSRPVDFLDLAVGIVRSLPRVVVTTAAANTGAEAVAAGY